MNNDNSDTERSFWAQARAVSPVISVVAMIGLALALAGIVAVATTDIVGNLGEEPGGTVQYEQEGAQVDISIQELDDNVDSVWVRGTTSGSVDTDNDGSGESAPPYQETSPSTGQVIRLVSVSEGDRITVVADDGQGNNKTIGTYTVGSTT